MQIKKVSQFVYECTYSPKKPGNYVVNVTYGPGHITKSPFKVHISRQLAVRVLRCVFLQGKSSQT